jgi:hypothetical protein
MNLNGYGRKRSWYCSCLEETTELCQDSGCPRQELNLGSLRYVDRNIGVSGRGGQWKIQDLQGNASERLCNSERGANGVKVTSAAGPQP